MGEPVDWQVTEGVTCVSCGKAVLFVWDGERCGACHSRRDVLTDEHRALVESALHLLTPIVHSLPRSPRPLDDERHDAFLGLVRAARHFDATRGDWLPFAFHVAQNVVRNARRKDTRADLTILDRPDEEGRTMADQLVASSLLEDEVNERAIATVADLVAPLPRGMRVALLASSDADAADQLGIHSESARRQRMRGLARLRREVAS